jgi:C1A family cysteine protease
VPESFEGPEIASTGVMRPPSPTERILGGHAVLAVGYDDIDESLLVRNSWGDDWGMSGYFTFPYSAWPMLSIDAWAGRVS